MHENDVSAIRKFSDGNARIAIALASTYMPGKSFVGLSDSELIKRLVFQTDAPSDELFRIACAFSLVYSFDGDYQSESGELSALSEIADVSERRLYEYCSELEQRKLIQIRAPWRALLPQALANRLAQQALDRFPSSVILDILMKTGNERLLRSFAHRLGYLHLNDTAVKIARQLIAHISANGFPFISEDLHSLVEYLAPVVPHETMQLIEEATSDREQISKLLEYHIYTDYTRLLAQLGYFPKLFESVTRALAAFSACQKKQHGDTAKQILMTYFQLYFSGTHASLEQKLKVIKSLIESDKAYYRILGIEAVNQALECWRWSSNGYNGMQFAAHSRDNGFHPDHIQVQKV